MSTPHTVERSNCYKFDRSLTQFTRGIDGKITDDITFDVYTDASQLPHTSQGGYYITSNNRNISSKSFRTHHYAGCSYHAELLALRTGVEAAVLVKEAMLDFGYTNVHIQVHCDNLPLVNIVLNGIPFKKLMNKILKNCYYMLRHNYKEQVFDIQHVKGTDNPADILTKTLGFTDMTRLMEHPAIASTFTLVLSPFPEELKAPVPFAPDLPNKK